MEKTVSIIIPVYNAEAFLERAVDSALVQNHVVEIILVDDGSKDNSLALCLAQQRKSSLIQVYTHPDRQNKGLAATRNRGLEFATGDWIQLLDADDELLPEKISSQLASTREETAFVVANSIDRFASGRDHPRVFEDSPWIGLITGKLGISSANLFNRKFIELVGGFDQNLRTSEEYDLMFRIMKLGYMPIFDPHFLTIIHKTDGSLSRGKNNQDVLIRNWVDLRWRIREFLIKKGWFELNMAYQYSGALGSFLKSHGRPLDDTVDPLLYRLYSIEKSTKIKLMKLVKRFKK